MINQFFRSATRSLTFVIAFILLISLFRNTALAQLILAKQLPTFTMGLVEFPPFAKTNPDTGQCEGSGIDTMMSLLNNNQAQLEVVCGSPARIYSEIEAGRVDFTINVKSTSSIKDFITFTDIPFALLSINFYQRTQKESTAHTNADSSPKKLAAIRDFDYVGYREHYLNQGFEFIDVPTPEDAVKLFISKRTDSLISYQRPYELYLHELEHNDYAHDDEHISVTSLIQAETFIGISRASKNYQRVVDIFDTIDKERKTKYLTDYTKN